MKRFTKEEINYLIEAIQNKSIKDSQFDSQNELYGNEWITLVDKDGYNKKIKIETLYRLLKGEDKEHLKNGIQQVQSVEDLDKFSTKEYGNLVYVKDEDAYYSFSVNDEWQSILKVYIGSEEPKDDNILWIDPQDDTTLNEEQNDDIANIKKILTELLNRTEKLENLTTIGVIPGDATNSYRKEIMATATPENPNPQEESNNTEDTEDTENTEDDSDDKPDSSDIKQTVKHNAVKLDTAINFAKNKQNLIDGDILFYTDKLKFAVYYGGKFYTATSSGSGGGSEGISVDDLYTLALNYLIFAQGENQYKVRVDSNGNWLVTLYNPNTQNAGSQIASWNNYISHLLCINSIYCGGSYSEEALCSHNYIELANGSKENINLKGLYLLYTDGKKENASDIGYIWKVLPLEGVIKAGSTFVIRGAQCNSIKSSFIKVDNYDMEWLDEGVPIVFNQEPSSFYLCAGDSFQELLDNKTLNNPWTASVVKTGYVDSCGFGSGSVGEGSKTFLVNDDWKKVLFVRWYMLEPAKQGNKAYASRATTSLWTYINLEKNDNNNGNSIQYYYPDDMKQKFSPKASNLNKDFFSNKTSFNQNKPNIINITFGRQATDNGNGATRCFNWVSVGYYNEFIEYRKKGTTDWTRLYSYIKNDSSNSTAINTFIEYYQRLRWCTSSGIWVTTHKRIISNLNAGTYEYRIGRDNDESYYSNIMQFTVLANTDVQSFSYIQTSDQQGFNWAEYTAWKKAAYMINKNEENYNFTINTGDITQSGNRPNEWLDYYDGRQYLRDKEEMFSIGNNDLCGHNATELTDGEDATSKYNHINILRYFTFELDENNPYSFVEWNDNTYPIYSVYSFNYGNYHFISLNSEIAIASSKMYKDWESDSYAGDKTFAQTANAQIENWLLKDLQLWTGQDNPTNCSKCIIYMHEMPFTIVTWNFMNSTSARAGSHLNTLNSNGNYRFSRLFKKYGIRLVMGGHKHTYCITKPVYDAPEGYINNGTVTNVDLMGDVTDALSRVPVIQVTRDQDILTNDFARYEKVNKINAPTYVMSQATGYKLVSNKEQPSGNQYVIPWLLAYFKAKTNAASPTENRAQHLPMYIRYDVTQDSIKVTPKQVQNIWNVNIDKNTANFDMNQQLSNLSVQNMTLSTTSSEDKSAYNISNIESYTIKL